MLHEIDFLAQMAHFNRETFAERQPHAKGAGAFGVFEITENVSAYTRAVLFQKGKVTELLASSSTVAGVCCPRAWQGARGQCAEARRRHGRELTPFRNRLRECTK